MLKTGQQVIVITNVYPKFKNLLGTITHMSYDGKTGALTSEYSPENLYIVAFKDGPTPHTHPYEYAYKKFYGDELIPATPLARLLYV